MVNPKEQGAGGRGGGGDVGGIVKRIQILAILFIKGKIAARAQVQFLSLCLLQTHLLLSDHSSSSSSSSVSLGVAAASSSADSSTSKAAAALVE